MKPETTASTTGIPTTEVVIGKMPQPHGGALNAGGTPGNKGGRPTNEFKARMARLADRAVRALEVATILDDPTDALYLPAAKWAAEHGYGKPKEQVEHSGTVGLQVQFVRERNEVTSSDVESTP